MFELTVEDTFHAAHALRGYEGPCENLHGHTFKVQVFVQGNKLNPLGLMIDFKELKAKLGEIISEFDHKLLNDIRPFDKKNPSSENLAKDIYFKFKEKVPAISKVTVWESPTSSASYYE